MELTLETKLKTISIMEKIQVKLISLIYIWPGVNYHCVQFWGFFEKVAINFMLSKSN